MRVTAQVFIRLRRLGRLVPVVVVLAALLAGCAGRGSAGADSRQAAARVGSVEAAAKGLDGEYHLGAGDKLRIVVFGHADVSGEFVIDGSGNVALPLVGQFRASQLTVTGVQESLQKTLNDKYIVNPRVSVEVLNYRPFFILGEVQKPGSYPYVAGIDVIQAVALGGGYTRRARTSSVRVTRDTAQGRTVLSLPPSAPVLPGDTIEVERRLF
jgi:polysaccharide export outer membrane protein